MVEIILFADRSSTLASPHREGNHGVGIWGVLRVDDCGSWGGVESDWVVRRSLQHIVTSPAAKVIGNHAFFDCSGLTTVILNDGLEEIEEYIFFNCRSLRRIVIPSTVKEI